MNLGQLIKDVHEHSVTIFNEDLERKFDRVYTKLLSVIDAYKRGRFASYNVLYSRYNLDFNDFKAGFAHQIKDTFEGELTEFLFTAFDIIGSIGEEYVYDYINSHKSSALNDFFSEISIDEELTYMAVKLEHTKNDNSLKLLEELIDSIYRVFELCKIENIGIKTHIKLNLLYLYSAI